jgi:hypothetical protein
LAKSLRQYRSIARPGAVRSSSDLLRQWLMSERVTISFVPSIHGAAMMDMHWPVETALR